MRFISHRRWHLADGDEWRAHPAEPGIDRMKVTPDPLGIATEGAIWGTVAGDGRIAGIMVTGDAAGQSSVGDAHASIRVHAERLVRKQRRSDEAQHTRVDAVLDDVRGHYLDLSGCGRVPRTERRKILSARFDGIFGRLTGYTGLGDLP